MRSNKITGVTLINMTPHPVKVRGEDGTLTVFQPSGTVPRVTNQETKIGTLDIGCISLYQTQMGNIVSLPEPKEGVFYIVSGLVKQRGESIGRKDLVVPSHLKRNDNGVVIEARGLSL